jgi:hypothetical protein
MKRKICVYVSEDLVSRLAVAAEHRGATKSGLVGAALDRFLNVAEEPDDHPGLDERLAQMSQQLDHVARELRFVNETVAMHARYHLTITPPLPAAAQPAACRIGAARFDEFAAQVGSRVDRDKPLIRETLDRLGAKNHERPSHEGQGPLRDAGEREHPVARETLNGHSVDADETPVVSELSGRGAAPGPFPSRSATPPTNPADGGVLQPDGPQAEWQTPGEGDRNGTRPAMEDRASGLQLILRVFLPFTIGYYLSYLFRTISAVTAEPLTAEFSLSPSSLGLLTSAYFFTFAVARSAFSSTVMVLARSRPCCL